ncbi:cytochrome P450 [Nocardioides daejeonensis]|uniref:cytochrome P450 n=1 Tax=Nocardioides daejeonensis TaxID=1046556 RepID=UPI000D74BC76|nr:cytochrome P450 [Nocardioides daejeonensis]
MDLPGVRTAREAAHWSITHGLPRTLIARLAAKGDLQARLILSSGTDGDEMFDLIEQVRARGPVVKSGLAYLTPDHAVVREVLTSNAFRTGIPGRTGLLGALGEWLSFSVLHPVEPPSLLVTEPPDHTRYRKLVMRVFTMRAVERLRVRTEQIATGLLDQLERRAAAGERIDLIEDYCAQLPVTVIAEILGVPEQDRDRVLAFGAAAAPSLDLGLPWQTYRDVNRALADFDAWLGEHLENLRRHPGDNLLSELVAVQTEEGVLSEIELKSTAGLVLAAGFETTVNLLGNGIALLHDHPDQLALLTESPELWANAVEEVLRFDPPVLLTGRQCQEETEVGGQRLKAGDLMTTMLAGANRDPAVFVDPARFDVTRENAREHLSFSAGRHHCLGAMLARMEGEVGLRMFFERFPDLALLPGAHRRTTRILRGFETLPAALSAAAVV